jgi:glycosidase
VGVAAAGLVVPAAWAQPVLSVNGLNANYTTTHVFVDEAAGTSVPLTVLFQPNAANLTDIEIYSNLNRRDRASQDANGDGIQDGILPPNGNLVIAGSHTHYYKAYTMTDIGEGQFSLTLMASNTGAYRLTGRYKVSGNTNWIYYNNFDNQRDHAIVVSPVAARDMVMYELNTLTVESEGTTEGLRSTFVDLWDGPGSKPWSVTTRFNLDYVKALGVNWLWFQPVHPQAVAGRQIDPVTGQPFEVGSPYAVQNFFEIMPLMGKGNTRAAAKVEFQDFVRAADSNAVNVMLDAPFNHTGFDCELAAAGASYFGGNATNQIREVEARFFSRVNEYDKRAYSAGSIAIAPDRTEFKFNDTYDVYFGRYASLVADAGQTGNHLNEGDWFDPSIGNEDWGGENNGHFDGIAHGVWRYFADYLLYWLDQTGCTNGTPKALQTGLGVDGLRADFAQGLPPQAWEYLVNVTRARKWSFVFMAESLDGGPVGYRSNRHFDVLNENLLFDLDGLANTATYRTAYEDRRSWYGQALILLNSTSHDEPNYADPYQAFIRYACNSTIDGVPMIFYGQELGISTTFGFDRYEDQNIGGTTKTIPHFKKFNSLQPILYPGNRTFALDQLCPVYAGVGHARRSSAALRSSNRYFLNTTGGSVPELLYSVAKYQTAGAPPNLSDVVFAFVNLDRDNVQSALFNVNIDSGGSNLFGIKSSRTYNVKNLAAYLGADPTRREVWLWGAGGLTGADVLANGIYVSLNRVPTNDTSWATAPFEPQYLKLYDVTPPPTVGTPSSPKPYVIGTNVVFSWPAASDPEGGISGYRLFVGTSPGGSNVFHAVVSGTSQSVSAPLGSTLYATVMAINNAGIPGSPSVSSAGVILLNPALDPDGDGMNSANEDLAGTNPLDPHSLLRILSLDADHTRLSWASVAGKQYNLWSASNLNLGFSLLSGGIPSAGAVTTYTNPASGSDIRFYKVEVLP